MQDANFAPGASWSIELPHAAAAVPTARALIRNVLTELEPPVAGTDTAELLTAELVANAVVHTRGSTPIQLVVELIPAGCQIEVHDPDPEPVSLAGVRELRPEPAGLAELSEGGRGLLLIRALSETAGCRRTRDGKAVWFVLPSPEA